MYSSGSNDESYTPDYGVKPILKYIPKDAIVWCPFDTEESEFVKQIGEQNEVIHSHIEDGCDFLTYEPEFHKWDVIVSNPPFTNKRKYFVYRKIQAKKHIKTIDNCFFCVKINVNTTNAEKNQQYFRRTGQCQI